MFPIFTKGDVLVVGMGNKATDIARSQAGQKALSPGYEFLTLSPEPAVTHLILSYLILSFLILSNWFDFCYQCDDRKSHLELRISSAKSFQGQNALEFLKSRNLVMFTYDNPNMTSVYMEEVVKLDVFEIMEGMRTHMKAGGRIEVQFYLCIKAQLKNARSTKLLCVLSSILLILFIYR